MYRHLPLSSTSAIARHLREWRAIRGLSQRALAERARVPLSVVRRLEDAQDVRLLDTLFVAQALGALSDWTDGLDPHAHEPALTLALEQAPPALDIAEIS